MNDQELLKVLGEAYGWRVSVESCVLYHFTHETLGAYVIGSESIVDAWEKLLRITKAPDWLHSVDAALYKLPWPKYSKVGGVYTLVIEQWADRAQVCLVYNSPYLGPDSYEEVEQRADAPLLARALSECFAQWYTDNKEAI